MSSKDVQCGGHAVQRHVEDLIALKPMPLNSTSKRTRRFCPSRATTSLSWRDAVIMEAVPFVIGAIPFVGGPFKGDLQRPGKTSLSAGVDWRAVRYAMVCWTT